MKPRARNIEKGQKSLFIITSLRFWDMGDVIRYRFLQVGGYKSFGVWFLFNHNILNEPVLPDD